MPDELTPSTNIEKFLAKTAGESVELPEPATRIEKYLNKIASEQTITEATDNWLDEHIDPTTGYVLDSTLTMNNAAPPASAVGDLKSAFTQNVCEKIKGWTTGKAIAFSGSVGDTLSLTPHNDASGAYVIVNCSEGDVFTLNGFGGLGYRLWCFVDADNKILDFSPIRTLYENKIITAPKNTAKLVLNQFIGGEVPYSSGGVQDCYVGILLKEMYTSQLPENKETPVEVSWEVGGVDGTGLINVPDNIRTKRSIAFNEGEKLVVTNTDKTLLFTVYSVKQNTYEIMSSGYVNSYGQLTLDDYSAAYLVRVRKLIETPGDISWASGISIKIVNDSEQNIPANGSKAKALVGFNRSYSYINPTLTYERKMLQEDGTLANSTTKCIAKLPATGCIEIKQQRYFGCFKVAKVQNGTVTWLVNDWSYYSYRYVGDGLSTYYLIVANSENTESTIYTNDAESNIAVYTFTDAGKDVKQFYYLNGKKVAFIGDSITQGRFAKYGTTLNWTTPKPFGGLIAETIGDDNYGNYGIGGALVYNSDWKSLYANCDKVSGYDVVFVCGGTNDYGNNVSEANFTTAYTYVIETLMANNTEVVACSPVYRTSKTGTNTQGLYLYDYGDIIKTIASTKGIKYIDLYTLTNNNKFINYLPDGLHPNEIGHRLMAENILNEYNKLSS